VIVVAGEALIDLVAVDRDGGYRAVVGGSPANVAVGLARLGRPTRLLARLSTDPFGQRIRAHLVANGVDLTWAARALEPTSLAIASVDEAGRAEYAFYLTGTADWQWTADELPQTLHAARAVHTGSLALAMAPGADPLEAMLGRSSVTVSIDLNLRPTILGDLARERDRVGRQIGHAHLVKASEEDLASLYPDRSVADIAASWRSAGVACVVVTLGAEGVYLLAPDGTSYHRPVRPTTVVDTVGAGDAFTAGLLAALADLDALGTDPAERLAAVTAPQWTAALDYANTVAALTCGRRGADPPTAAEVTAELAPGGPVQVAGPGPGQRLGQEAVDTAGP
jgi:fructokinase